jgi:hypothetical protein
MPGKYVSLEDTIRSFALILDGEYDHLPEQAFLYCGAVEDVVEKARAMGAGLTMADAEKRALRLEISAMDRDTLVLDAAEVAAPGAAGRFVVLPGHAPMLASLVAGVVRVRTAAGDHRLFAVNGGVVHVLEGGVLLPHPHRGGGPRNRPAPRARGAAPREARLAERAGGTDIPRAEAARARARARIGAAARPSAGA